MNTRTPTTIYEGVPTAPNDLATLKTMVARKYQNLIERTISFIVQRWVALGVLFLIYLLRIYFHGGFYVITYALGIFLLTQVIAFLSPKWDPESQDDGMALPMKGDDEAKPFVRRLPEFLFWHSILKAIVISIFCTFIPFLDLPVFWPILLIYFIILFTITMRNQIRHMIKHKYIPFTVGKKVYNTRD
ncbi:retention in endoplasmic reticulum 1-like protein [Heterostelium album PN500]|uniref:Protein RER1 n=1 Tax=Heterostelium pallidum (strain ATCC 26659 / Pp 5 / PN500) TaxID=670386 RepID=D3BCE9_HETP5|nr:retention in endoplasmic reticulum 1-like protein [Heterostelium album PN500]EFA80939.1 retention in endoplasmic reticulum 1-like protein [Heterostelium album PN500]|eukprot:XP_020433057.1 retention in endoplasmic reticulum 1-like protein [Heterostelium album PN500]